MNQSAVFLGVNQGYQGDLVQVTDTKAALAIAKQNFKQLGLDEKYDVMPGLAVYHTDWGCPEGGEAGVMVTNNGDVALGQFIEDSDKLSKNLIQTAHTIGVYEETIPQKWSGDATQTVGLKGTVSGVDLKELAVVWQEEAKKAYENQGVYISTTLYQSNQAVVIQAEAVPALVGDNLEKWQEVAESVASAVSERVSANIELKFSPATIIYRVNDKDIGTEIEAGAATVIGGKEKEIGM